MTKTELNCLQHQGKSRTVNDDYHTKPSAETIVHYQHKQNPNVLYKDEKARMKTLNV